MSDLPYLNPILYLPLLGKWLRHIFCSPINVFPARPSLAASVIDILLGNTNSSFQMTNPAKKVSNEGLQMSFLLPNNRISVDACIINNTARLVNRWSRHFTFCLLRKETNTMKIDKLTQAIAITLSGSALLGAPTAGASTTSYNAFNHDAPAPAQLVSGENGTDGWMRTSTNACGVAGSTCGHGPATYNNPDKILANGNEAVPWVGNDPRTDPNFNYIGHQTLNWTAVIGADETAEISRLDSHKYGGTLLTDGTTFQYADIDTARGAWHDGRSTGFKYDTDIGLFKSSVTQSVTLSISSLLSEGQVDVTPTYGFTIFEGMDTTTRDYTHHGPWHEWDSETAAGVGDNVYQLTDPNPFTSYLDIAEVPPGSGNFEIISLAGSGVENLILDDVAGNSATFTAEAGKAYTIFLGGFQSGYWTDTRNNYQLMISSAPVPVPGAVWLFGSALAGFIGIQRRKGTNA